MPTVGSENRFPKIRLVEGAAPATPASGEVHLYVKSDGLLYWKDDAGTEYAVSTGGDVSVHLADATGAHAATAVSADSTGYDNSAGDDVQEILDDFDAAITAGGGGGGGSLTLTDIPPTSDTYIAQDVATTNYESANSLSIADKVNSPGGYTKCPILTFDLSGLSDEVARADLMLYGHGSGNAGIFTGHIGARKVVRSGVVLTQATWNVYATASNWATAGARGPADTHQLWEAVAVWQSPANQEVGWFALDLTGMVRRALMLSETSLTVLLGAIDTVTGSQNELTFSSLEHATAGQRPRLSVLTG